jgi:hypothetical protein
MMHTTRVWSVDPVASAEELARKLTESTWCCCTGFSLGGYVWLNDATSPDGAQEYAIIKLCAGEVRPQQIESITFSWCNYERALELIQRTLQGDYDDSDFTVEVSPTLQSPEKHGRCPHCA